MTSTRRKTPSLPLPIAFPQIDRDLVHAAALLLGLKDSSFAREAAVLAARTLLEERDA